jgi:sugar phosphate isomerase/epimerase
VNHEPRTAQEELHPGRGNVRPVADAREARTPRLAAGRRERHPEALPRHRRECDREGAASPQADRCRPGAHGRAADPLAYDYDRSKDLPPLPEVGTHTLDEMWRNVTYFLKAVVPVAEESGVRLALHPNDPPVPLSRGSGQIRATLDGWKRLIEIVPSPSNGITYDCGVTRELGEDPVEVCRWFGERDRINHVHYRNVRVRRPGVAYTEVFPDEGQVDLFAVMKELVRQRYSRPTRRRCSRPRCPGDRAARA